MKILVCVKAVKDPGAGGIRMNRFDTFALEEALLIRKSAGAGTVEAACAGPENVGPVLTRAVGLGADKGIHLPVEEAPFPDPFATASLIAACARERGCDLVLCGVMSEDLMQGQVGPMLAELLDFPSLTAVVAARLSPDGKQMDVEREIEGGRREKWTIRLPALLTIQSGINTPRYPALSRMLLAVRKSHETIGQKAPAFPRILQRVVRTGLPEKQRAGRVLEGTRAGKADALLAIFREKGFLRKG